ncbi:hypothetical protein [Nesterenkonia sp.]|uniref:AraC-like ligand-binding domain-containing protein n=1 Tax=Nesterenkonia sp. TaxID=704201 RepID=UPI00261AC5CF|nr:hypothetical protein [Nesterenkonia sp.]
MAHSGSSAVLRAADESSWAQIVEGSVLPFTVDVPRAETFAGSIRASQLFDVGLFTMTCQRHAAARSRAEIRATAREEVVLTLQRTGRMRLRQHGRQTTLQPGEFLLFTSADPVQLEGSDDYSALGVRIPVSRFRTAGTQLQEITARSFSADQGLGRSGLDTGGPAPARRRPDRGSQCGFGLPSSGGAG